MAVGGARKGAGRPAGSGRGAIDKIEIRVTPEERAAWTTAAGDESLSSWIRARLNASAKRTAR